MKTIQADSSRLTRATLHVSHMDILRSTEAGETQASKSSSQNGGRRTQGNEDDSLQHADGSPYEAHIPEDSANGQTLKSYIHRV